MTFADQGDFAFSPSPPPQSLQHPPRPIGDAIDKGSSLDDTQVQKVKVDKDNPVKSDWSCDHYKALSSANACHNKDTHGQEVTNCVNSIQECAEIASADSSCSNVFTFYGSSGEYPGKCLCVTQGQDCGGWAAKGATTYKFTGG